VPQRQNHHQQAFAVLAPNNHHIRAVLIQPAVIELEAMDQKPLLPGEKLYLKDLFGESDTREPVGGFFGEFAPRRCKDARRLTTERHTAG
jgi:hypothetical protein